MGLGSQFVSVTHLKNKGVPDDTIIAKGVKYGNSRAFNECSGWIREQLGQAAQQKNTSAMALCVDIAQFCHEGKTSNAGETLFQEAQKEHDELTGMLRNGMV